ncbi:hypothetical protein [Streptomyces griseorubiginosus]|uniref:hypothetical protein n=1 Tax=Streptomyces griseorubiginosus TaxID=67304 RepID=UPI0033262C9C
MPFGTGDRDARELTGVSWGADSADDPEGDAQAVRPEAAPARAPTNRRLLQQPFVLPIRAHSG